MAGQPCPGERVGAGVSAALPGAAAAARPHLPGEHARPALPQHRVRYSLSIVVPLPGVLCPEDVPSQWFRIFPILVLLIFVLSSQSLDFFEKVFDYSRILQKENINAGFLFFFFFFLNETYVG